MHEIQFSDAVRAIPASVLKLKLREYSLGHEILLFKIRSPFVCLSDSQFNQLSKVEQVIALRRAVLICSNDWNGNQKPQRWLKLWGWITRNANYPLSIAEFRNYLTAGHALLPAPDSVGPSPENNFPNADEVCNGKREEGASRRLGGPFVAQLYNFMAAQRYDGCIWDCSYAFAAALYFTHLETEGNRRIENLNELEEKEQIQGHFDAWKKEKDSEKESKKTANLATEIPDELLK